MSRVSGQKSVSRLNYEPPKFDASRYANKNIGVSDVEKLKQCFDIFDYDKSGSVSMEQLSTAIRALGLEKDAGKILQIVSSHTEDEMDFEMFLEIFGFSDSASERSLHQLFEIFDKKNVGSFGVEQFAEICESVGERFSMSELQQMIDYADKDRDGRISLEQFLEVVTKEYPQV